MPLRNSPRWGRLLGATAAACIIIGATSAEADLRPPQRVTRPFRPSRPLVRPVRPLVPHRFFGLRYPRIYPQHRYPPLLLNPPPEDDLPPAVEPSQPLEDVPSDEAPLPHGFVLTVGVGGVDRPPRLASLTKYREVGTALGACWTLPASLAWGSITLRVAFKADGTVYGLPRFPYIDAQADDAKAKLAQSLGAALNSCTPLPFSHRLGAAVAGEIFAIRFINQGQHDDRH